MSDKFNGFSQDEINRLTSGGSASNKQKKNTAVETMKSATFRGGHRGIKRMPTDDKSNNNRRQNQPGKMSTQATASVATANANLVNGVGHKNKKSEQIKSINANDDFMDDINPDSSMSKSIEEALFFQPFTSKQQQQKHLASTKSKTSLTQNTMATKSVEPQSAPSSNDSSILKLNNEVNSQISSTTSSLEDSSILPSAHQISSQKSSPIGRNVPAALEVQSPFKGISLKDFETHRKMIEEQNRQKKEMLYKAIEQHSQKTAAEARKIEEIKAELSKLDSDLAVDVALLRKQIDNACIHFATVEKQYMKIESQFLKAKMDLHNAAEKKELLTEHLCTVIAHNEDRKAQKLSELMEKVGLAANDHYEPPTSTSN